jgi:hypothetical protein
MAFLPVALLASAILCQPARAGAWTQPKGKTYLRTSLQAYSADRYYDDTGNAFDGDWWDPEATFSAATISQVLEYGWRDDLTFLFDARFRSLLADRGSTGLRDDQVSGLGDVGIGLRGKLPTKSLVAAIQGRIEVPGGYDADRADYALGAGEVNLEGRFQIGGSLGTRPSWWNGEGGYRLRGGDFGDEIVFALAAGVEVGRHLWVRLGFGGVSALETTVVDIGDPDQRDPSQTASYASVGGALSWVLSPGATVEVGISSDVAGQNTFQGRSLEVALELRP